MITSFLLAIAALLINIFASFFGQLNWTFPSWFTDSITVFVNTAATFRTFLPFIADIFALALIVLPAHVIRYLISLALWAFSLIPWIGKYINLPTHKYIKENIAISSVDDAGHVKVTSRSSVRLQDIKSHLF